MAGLEPALPKETDFEAAALLTALKQLLRERRIGYQAIADALEVSLPTVKRMLNKPNMPLDRLFAVCKIARVEPSEVFTRAEKERPTHTIFTAEQDELFFKKPEFFTYFKMLTDEGLSPEDIAHAENLTIQSTQKYLSELARVALIERDVGTKIRILVKPPFGFAPDSKVLRAQHADFLQRVVSQVLTPNRPEGVFAILKPLCLQSELYSEMLEELTAIIDNYAYHSEHPSNREAPNRSPWSLALATGPGSTGESTPLKPI